MNTLNHEHEYVKFINVSKRYKMGEQFIVALNNLSFSINQGEFVVISGPSGAGKTTLINILGGMDIADEGEVLLAGNNIAAYSKKQLTNYRCYDIGFVFQFYNLMQNLTALENVELATEICSQKVDCKQILKDVGLHERTSNFPSQLSGGEQQRVAIARALAKNPKLLLCDEPTGALDYNTGKTILKLLWDTCKKTGKTVIVITHNQSIASMANRVIKMKNGEAVCVTINEHPIDVNEIEW